ncbi:hypothetical protein CEY16_09505 [Halalkalibacillus sediminis]|uniref:DUF3993 domain-containing protein n=1 Tax=Halalkalibacillus sediminis TaxID=2018042 RepID=A0A2I0QV12_9BACI|nr:hypothetical protein [Halalkalibacillus sediminis]PKR78139.1 hypothetical protein CEY16_09505 [Halalkalibacillus sediminis]
MKNLSYLVIITALIIALPTALSQVNAETEVHEMDKQKNHQSELKDKEVNIEAEVDSKEENEQESATLTDKQIKYVTEEFMSRLVQEADENYKVKNFDTLAKLKEHFQPLASEDVINEFVNYFYKEQEDGLYIVPTETPAWFIPDNDYEVENVNEQEYVVTQTNQTELDGTYTIVFNIQLNEDGKATIIDVQYQ